MEIYKNANEKYTAAIVAYADSDDGHLFKDSTHETKFTKEEVMNHFQKGLLLVSFQSALYRPVCCKDDGDSADVVVHDDTSNYTFNSDGAAAMSAMAEHSEDDEADV